THSVPRAVVPRAALVRGVMGKSRSVRHLRQDHDRRTSEQCLQIPLSGIAGDPLALAHHDDRLPRKPTERLCHVRSEGFLPYLYGTNCGVVLEGRPECHRQAAWHADDESNSSVLKCFEDRIECAALSRDRIYTHDDL